MMRALAGASLLLLLAGCGSNEDPSGTSAEKVRIAPRNDALEAEQAERPLTPMAERVAVIGILNKRNGLTRDLVMKPGRALRWGDAIVRLRACETSAPWEDALETGAFVQLDVRSVKDGKWRRTFSGWLFRERPERNVVQHPVYDVWVKSCAMEWPETGPDTLKAGDESASGAKASNASGPAPEANSDASSPSGTPTSAADSND